jgi:hypothetical protein
MQNKITKPSRLLYKNGELIQKGYATSPILRYCRKYVAKKYRLKEWDYYLINNKKHALALTIGKSLNLILISVSVIDLRDRKILSKDIIRIVPRKFQLPQSSSDGNIVYKDKSIKLSFRIEGKIRILLLKKLGSNKSPELNISLVLYNEPRDSMVIATPFQEDTRDFYYNRKIIGMKASGYVRYQKNTYMFSPISSFALLDWGRGVWPYKTTWYWSAASGTVHGKTFGFNLGYGFGDTTSATENMLFYNGKASKLNIITFHIPTDDNNKYDYFKPWTITSSDQRFEMLFVPIIDRSVNLPLLIISTNQHQVFGLFTGKAILDDGTVIHIKDFLGFAERVDNRW